MRDSHVTRRLCFALHGCRWQKDSSQEGKKYREVNGARQGEGRRSPCRYCSCVPYAEIELLTFRAKGPTLDILGTMSLTCFLATT